MEDFKEQYTRELFYQEKRADKYTLHGFVWFLAVEGLVWLLNLTGFFEVDQKLFTIAFVSTWILFLPALYIWVKGSLGEPWLKYFLLVLICTACGVIVSFLSFHAVLLYVIPLLFAIQYRKKKVLWFAYGFNTITMLISSLVSFYYGLCDLNLLLQSRHVRSCYLNSVTDGVLTLPINQNPVFIIIVFEVFPRSIILLLFVIIIQYTMISSSDDAYRIARLTYLKEMDVKTRVFNKNKYEEMVEKYYPKIENIGVIFWDLNNLKYINDKYGHVMGDKAIEKLSGVLYHYSDDRHRVYRIGGDEFLMVIDNPRPGETEKLEEEAGKNLKKENENDSIKISSAAGLALGKGKDIRKVVETADSRMYENKKSIRMSRK